MTVTKPSYFNTHFYIVLFYSVPYIVFRRIVLYFDAIGRMSTKLK